MLVFLLQSDNVLEKGELIKQNIKKINSPATVIRYIKGDRIQKRRQFNMSINLLMKVMTDNSRRNNRVCSYVQSESNWIIIVIFSW